jgi:hypothetical protein
MTTPTHDHILIAAAPELLEVLRDILAFEESASVDEPEAERLIARAKAAIAKATGETP